MSALSMMDRIINMVHKTGDKAVFFERETEEAVVVMDFDCYEKMLDPGRIEELTEEELMEKINKDIAVWRANNEENQTEIYSQALAVSPSYQPPPQRGPASMRWEGVGGVAEGEELHAEAKKETLKDIPQETAQETTEEKFYLEPVE